MASNNEKDYAMEGIVIIFALFIAGWGISYLWGNEIMSACIQVKLFWVNLYKHIFSSSENLNTAYNGLTIYTPKEWSYGRMSSLSDSINIFIAPPFMILFGLYAYKIISKNPVNKFKRKLDRQKLSESEVKEWPWIAPVLKLNLVKESIIEGPWAMALPVLPFCRKFRLLAENNKLDRERAEVLFITQLGQLWQGPDALPMHARALLACFLAHLNEDGKSCEKGLATLATSVASGKIDYSFVDGLLDKYIDTPISKKTMSVNAYATNVLCTVLEKSKEINGVLPPSYFVWLRPVDRSLWYALNCVGRRVPFCEVAGIFGHGSAEKVAGHPIEKPFVLKSVDGLEKGLQDVKID